MAEDTKDTSERPKRRLKAAPETVRERTEKLQQKDSAPKKSGIVGVFIRGFFGPIKWLGRHIAKLGRYRVFRWLSYIVLPPYVRNSWRELRQVTWPNRSQTLRLTYAVIVFSIIFGLIVAAVDFVLGKIFEEIIT